MLRQIRYHQVVRMAVPLFMATLLNACSDEAEPVETPSRTVHLFLGAQGFQDVSEGSAEAKTRALPEGFVTYGSIYTPTLPASAQIQGFFATSGTDPDPVQSVFLFDDDVSGKRSWSANVPISASGTCYFFGFLPKEETGNGSITPHNSDYSNGAVMTINNINAVAASDVCVVVGVLRNDNNTDPITDLDMASRLGKFDFTLQTGDTNYLYLLGDHLFSSLRFMIKIDATYNELRTIRVKQVRLLVGDGSSAVRTVNATVTLVANDSQQNPLSTEAGGSVALTMGTTGEPSPATLYNYTDDTANSTSGLALTTTEAAFRGYVAPGFNTTFILETVYDVYDSQGNLIRENDSARNTLPSAGSLARGQEYTYHITVNPTYLYMLSEPDLDSPTFTIE